MTNMSPHYDLEIRIDAALGEKLLNALEFPLHLDFSPEDESDLPIESVDDSMEDGLEALVEDVVAQPLVTHLDRSEERRVGKECRSRWWAEYSKEKRHE